jgi:hypothetical protein
MPFDAGIEASWCLALHAAFEEGLRFGRDVIFTFGPFGFLLSKAYFPSIFTFTLLTSALIAVTFWWSTFSAVRNTTDNPALGVLLLTALAGAAGVGFEQVFFSFGALLLVHHFYLNTRLISLSMVLLIGTMALASLIKFSFLIVAVLVIVIISADEVVNKKRLPGCLLLFAGILACLWLSAGQSFPDALAFLATSVEVASGYADAMSVAGPRPEVFSFLGVATLFFVLVVLLEWHTRHARGVLPLVGLAGLLFLLFKAGYIRHDGHVLISTFTLLVVILLYTPLLWRNLSAPAARGVCLFVVAAAVAVAWSSLARYQNISLPTMYFWSVKTLPARMAAGVRLVDGTIDPVPPYESSLKQLRADYPLPVVNGKVDVYPFKQAVAFAHGLEYSPRPVIQSYVAYTPRLAASNAEHLRGPRAPDSILFDVDPVDGRFPSLDDGLSWPELLTRYDVREVSPNFLLLERSEAPREFHFEPLGEVSASLGVPLDVPEITEGPVWVRINMRRTLVGLAMTHLYRNPQVFITVKLASGAERRYRIIPSMARAGFLLSPLIGDRMAFFRLATGSSGKQLAPLAVEKMTISVDAKREWFYEPELSVSLFRLAFAGQPAVAKKGVRELLTLHALAEKRVSPVEQPQVAPGPGGHVLPAHPPAQVILPITGTERMVRIGFGIIDGAWQGSNSTDGVEFRISAVVEGQSRELWSRHLDPRNAAGDRGLQYAEVTIPYPDATALVFETLPRANASWDWSYWSEIVCG